MKCRIPEISWHNREPVLSIDIQKKKEGNLFYRLASSGTDTHVIIWFITVNEAGMSDIEFASDLQRHQSAVNVVRFSPCGEFLASGDDDSTIIIWKQKTDQDLPELPTEDVDSNKEQWMSVRVLRGHVEDVYDLCWSPDSTRLISGSVDNSAILWKVHKGKKLAILSDHKSFVQGVAWDPKNKYVCTLGGDRTCRIFNLTSFKVMYRVNKACLPVPDGSDMDGKVVRLFHDDTFKSYFRRLSFSPDGEILIAPSGIIESSDSKKLSNCTFIFARRALNKPVVYLPSSDQFTVAVRCCPLLFKLREGESLFALPYRIIFAVATQSSVVLYDTQQAEPFGIISNITYTRLTDLSWSSDARVLVVSSTDGYCSIVNFSEGELGVVYDKVVTTNIPNPEMCNSPKKSKNGKKKSEKISTLKSENKNSEDSLKHMSEISNNSSANDKNKIDETEMQQSDIQDLSKNFDSKKNSLYKEDSENKNCEVSKVSNVTSVHADDIMDTTEKEDSNIRDASENSEVTLEDSDIRDTSEEADSKNGSSCQQDSKDKTSGALKQSDITSSFTDSVMDTTEKEVLDICDMPEGENGNKSSFCKPDFENKTSEESKVPKATSENTNAMIDSTRKEDCDNECSDKINENSSSCQQDFENKTSKKPKVTKVTSDDMMDTTETDDQMNTAEKKYSDICDTFEDKDSKNGSSHKQDSENKTSEVTKLTSEDAGDMMDVTGEDLVAHNESACKDIKSGSSSQQVSGNEDSKVSDSTSVCTDMIHISNKEVSKCDLTGDPRQESSSDQQNSALLNENKNCEVNVLDVSSNTDTKNNSLTSDSAVSDILNSGNASEIISENNSFVSNYESVICQNNGCISEASLDLKSTPEVKMNGPEKNSDMEKSKTILNTMPEEDLKVRPSGESTNTLISARETESENKCLEQLSDVIVTTSECSKNSEIKSDISNSLK